MKLPPTAQPPLEALRRGSTPARLVSLLRDSATYGTVDVLGQMLGILLVPIIVRVFAVEEYAVVDGLRIASVLLLGIALLGLNQAAARFISQTDDARAQREVVGQALAAALLVAIALASLLAALAPGALGFFLGTSAPPHVRAFRLMLAALPALVWVAFAKMLLKWHFRRRAFVGLSLGHTAGVLGLTVMLVVVGRRGIPGIFEAQLLGAAAAGLAAVLLCARHVGIPRGSRGMRPLFAFGSPLMLVGVLQNLVPSIERFLIVRFLGLDALGLYAVGQRFTGLIHVPVGGFHVAWTPFAYAIHREPDAPRTFRRVLDLYAVLLAGGALLFVLLADWALPLFASDRYAAALAVVVPLLYAAVVGSISNITGLGIALAGRTYLSTLAYAVHLIVTAAGILLLARPCGIVGIAYAALFGRLSLTLFETIAAARVHPLRFRWSIATGALLVSFGAALAVERLVWGGH